MSGFAIKVLSVVIFRSVALMVERRSPKPNVAGSSPAWPVSFNIVGTVIMKIFQFFKECGAELKKVVWPSRDDILSSVKVVLISTVVVAVILGLLDFLFNSGMNLVF